MSEIQSYLAEHPKMMGVLFTMMLFLSQAGSVAASNVADISGP